jgi:hypothetical protein
MLHATEMQGHSDDDEVDIQAPVIPNIAIDPPAATQVQELVHNEAAGPTEHLMLLSVETLHGIPGEGTLSVQLQIGNKKVVALIDSGSTNTFMDKKFALSNQHTLIHVPALTKRY